MPLCGKYVCGEASVAVWEITETVGELQTLLDAPEASCVENFQSTERRCEWLAVRLLLKCMCGADARIVYDAAGKPFLEGGGACISVSHTKGYAALAVSRTCPVGLDIELAAREVGAVARRFMREQELVSVPASLHNAAKLLRWVASEALFKITGDLGGNYRDNIVPDKFLPACSGVFSLSLVGVPCASSGYSVSYLFDGPLLIALCREGAGEALVAAGEAL